jgi:lysophospholipase L1-like esterase
MKVILALLPIWIILSYLFVTYESTNKVYFGIYSLGYLLFLGGWFLSTILVGRVIVKLSQKTNFVQKLLTKYENQLTNLILVNVTLFLLVLGLEGGIRLTDLHGISYYFESQRYFEAMQKSDTLLYQHTPGYVDVLQGVSVQINPQGLRDTARAYQKPKELIRILLLGDSVTFGWGVRQADTYSEQLELLLNNYNDITVEVINGGVGSYNTYQEATYLKQEGVKYQPDIVTLLFIENDIQSKFLLASPSPHPEGGLGKKSDQILRNIGDYLSARSYLVMYIRHFSGQLLTAIAPPEPIDLSNHPGWLETRRSLIEIAQMSKEKGFYFLLFYYFTGRNGGNNRQLYQLVEELGQEHNFPVISLFPYFKDQNIFEITNSVVDAHPNKKGHAIIAQAYFENIITLTDLFEN